MESLEKVVANLVQKVERRFYGKYRGFVVDNADPEHLGRLKLTVPSVLGDQEVTGWAMPCLPYGGEADQGFLFIPENNAGVWVEFEEGDLEFPIWVGTFWSKPEGKSELPKPNDKDGNEQNKVQDPPTRKIIKTKLGHTIQMEDNDDHAEVIIVEGKKGHLIMMDEEGIKITDAAKNEIVMNSSGITIKSDQINIGESATDPLVLGRKLETALENWINTVFLTHMHTGNLGAPTPYLSGPPPDFILDRALSETNNVK